jgi:hypothetical protein
MTDELYDHETINGHETGEYVQDAAVAFLTAALDDLTWDGDEKGTGENPLDLRASAWAPVALSDIAGAYTDPAQSPETQVENALGIDRVREIVNALHIGPETFGDRLYLDLNGTGTGFWDMVIHASPERPENWTSLLSELSDAIGYGHWAIEYHYDPVADPEGDDVTLQVQAG